MASKAESSSPPARKAARPRKTAGGGTPASVCVKAAETPAAHAAEELLRAGLKAFKLDNLMGLVPPKKSARGDAGVPGLGFSGLEGFGFRKFEDVFDQRVAGALQRLGWPGAQEMQVLQAEIERLRAEVDQLSASRRKPPAPAPAARGGRSGR